jgi:hypothetical protein
MAIVASSIVGRSRFGWRNVTDDISTSGMPSAAGRSSVARAEALPGARVREATRQNFASRRHAIDAAEMSALLSVHIARAIEPRRMPPALSAIAARS